MLFKGDWQEMLLFPIKPAVTCQSLSKFCRFTWVFLNNMFHKFHHLPPSEKKPLVDLSQKVNASSPLNSSFHVISQETSFSAVAIAPVLLYFTFVLFAYTQVIAILILIKVQYLQNVVFSFEKCFNGQRHSSSDCHQPIKQSPCP